MTAPKPRPRNCGNCRFSQFTLTPSGGFKKSAVGKCLYPMPKMTPLPEVARFTPIIYHGAWPDFGTQCPVWEGK